MVDFKTDLAGNLRKNEPGALAVEPTLVTTPTPVPTPTPAPTPALSSIVLTAVKQSYYKVLKDGVLKTSHSFEKEAVESAVNLKIQSPSSKVSYYHDFTVNVDLKF